MKITDFYYNDYSDYSSYDNLRKIASAIDGQKNSSRKILCTVIDKNITQELKVSQLSNKMAEYTEYLHGDASGVVVTMAQNFAGTNNLPLLVREGNFGTRFINDASAPRYIKTHGSDQLWEIFNKDDKNILVKQFFEGDQIEPVFYLPNLPMLLINGAEGVSSGFAQKVLPRNPKAIRKYLDLRLQMKDYSKQVSNGTFTPYFEGFKGTIQQGEHNKQWIIKGVVQRLNSTKVKITELPVGYNLKSYIKVLDKLEDDKVITRYKDLSDNDNFEFDINFLGMNLKKLSDQQLLSKLKLVKTVSENYTCMGEENSILVFDNAVEIFDYYYNIKLKYLQYRKDYLIEKIAIDIDFDHSKFLFIKGITEGTLIVNKRKKAQIEADLVMIEGIIPNEKGYDYLLNLPIHSLTEERMKKLQDEMRNKKAQLVLTKKTTINEMWSIEL